MVRKLLKTASHRYISAGFVIGFFFLVMTCSLLQIRYSTIVLILASGFLGVCIYSVIGRREP